jgi:hypothetical protein
MGAWLPVRLSKEQGHSHTNRLAHRDGDLLKRLPPWYDGPPESPKQMPRLSFGLPRFERCGDRLAGTHRLRGLQHAIEEVGRGVNQLGMRLSEFGHH